MNKILEATSKLHYNAAVGLFKEYAAGLQIDLDFQNFNDELENVAEMYAAPLGIILLCANNENNFIGCVAVRNKGEHIAELKRMYVKHEHRKEGIAKKLLKESLVFAKNAGYKKIRLDTLATMTPAINLYKQFDFYEIEAYYYNPEGNAVFFEKLL